jgi:hypothetical protein
MVRHQRLAQTPLWWKGLIFSKCHHCQRGYCTIASVDKTLIVTPKKVWWDCSLATVRLGSELSLADVDSLVADLGNLLALLAVLLLLEVVLLESVSSNSLPCLLPGNTKGGSITVQLTSCLTGLESAVWLLTIFYLLPKQANPNQSNRRSTVQWYFHL